MNRKDAVKGAKKRFKKGRITMAAREEMQQKTMAVGGEAKWIWLNEKSEVDEYAEFCSAFDGTGGKITLKISADSEYAVFLNGAFVYGGQYADFPWYKVYDEIDLSPFARKGENVLSVHVWHVGDKSFCHYVDRGGLFFCVEEDGKEIAVSGKGTKCRKLPRFVCGRRTRINMMAGFTFCISTEEQEQPFKEATEIAGMPQTLYLRPIELLKILPELSAKRIAEKVYDLGRETVGFPYVEFSAPKGAEIEVAFGERLTEQGHVPGHIGDYNFTYTLVGNGERVRVFNPLRKLGCRYFEIIGDCFVYDVGVVPLEYPFEDVTRKFSSPLRQSVYDTAVRTLKLNAFEHYYDCPWREQAFYALDSRLQMRYGYTAFTTTEYQYGALKLMSEDRHPSGLISIVVPTTDEAVIPSFTFSYIDAMAEYAEHTGDTRLIERYFDKIAALTDVFLSRMKDGLIENFDGKAYWNFYEWNEKLDGSWHFSEDPSSRYQRDCALNLNFVLALNSVIKICKALGKDSAVYEKTATLLKKRINEVFFREKDGLYAFSEDESYYTDLCNAYAVLSEMATGERAEKICERLADENGGLVECSLSMLAYKYDALLKCNREKYAPFVLADIDKKFGYMLKEGATSFWETMKGWRDFDEAGSLCHGWSALPVYYYVLLGESGEGK